jgi:hypothetical protein
MKTRATGAALEPNPSDWYCLLSCVREDIVVVMIMLLVLVSLMLCARELA